MTRQETIDSLKKILDRKNNFMIIYSNAEALEKAIKVLKQMSDDEYEYLTFEINHKGE